MKVKHYEEDQAILKDKYNETKQTKTLNDKLDQIIQDLKLKLSLSDRTHLELTTKLSEIKVKAKNLHKELLSERQTTATLTHKLKKLECIVKREQEEKANYKSYVEGVEADREMQEFSVIAKGKKLLESSRKFTQPNVLSQQLT